MSYSTYKIQHRLIGPDGYECELYSEIEAQSTEDARDKFLNEHTKDVLYWDIEIDNIIQKKYS